MDISVGVKQAVVYVFVSLFLKSKLTWFILVDVVSGLSSLEVVDLVCAQVV
ncbi:MAG: hypothetical protein GY763_13410 [Gammaproteobacteria bacterium]|nr:hypothetical protein [Gammaproteobacteria bacterium]